MLISAQFRNTNAVLNHVAQRLSGADVSFLVHFWGANPQHFLNSHHKHSFFWMCYVLDGYGHYLEDGTTSLLAKGTIFCSRPEQWHQIQSDLGMSILWVSFEVLESESSELFIEQFRRIAAAPDYIRNHADNTPTARIWQALWSQAEHFQPPFAGIVASMAHSLLASFTQLFGDSRIEADKEMLHHHMSSVLIRQASLYIDDNISQPLLLEEVSRYFYISGRHLSRLFVRETGLSFSAYVRKQRMEKAIRLLHQTDMTIEQISQQCGFGSVHYFTRVFTTEINSPPGIYRKWLGE